MKDSRKLIIGGFAIASALCFTSCSTDNDYDLSNIDGTAKIAVNNLVVPLNLDALKLGTVLNLGENSTIEEETLSDGTVQYCVKKYGDFTSDEVKVNTVQLSGSDFQQNDAVNSPSTQVLPSAVVAEYDIPKTEVKMSFESTNVDKSVLSVEKIGMETFDVVMKVVFAGLTQDQNVVMNNLRISTINGLIVSSATGGSYASNATKGGHGVVTVPNGSYSTWDGSHQTYIITLHTTGIDCELAGIAIDSNHEIHYSDKAHIMDGGKAVVTFASGVTPPNVINYTISNNMPSSTVNSFTGYISKTMTVNDPDPIDLSNLPEMLTQSGTSIKLTGARLNLTVNNPMVEKGYSLPVNTKLKLTGNKEYSSEAIVLSKSSNDIEMSDSQQDQTKQWVKFEGINEILTGDKQYQSIPSYVYIDIEDPTVAKTHIENFKLGDNFSKVNGHWTFYTPLAITDDSQIKYNKDWSDWSDDDLKYLTMEGGKLHLSITNNVPLAIDGITFSVYSKDKTKTLSGEFKEEIGTGATKEIDMPLTGSVSDMDGATINCTIKGGMTAGQEKALQPSQTITIKDVKMTVNGYYQKKF